MELKRKINKIIIIPFLVLMLITFFGITIITTYQIYTNLHRSLEDQNLRLVEQISEIQQTTAKSYIKATSDLISRSITKDLKFKTNIETSVTDFELYLKDYLYNQNIFYDGYVYTVNQNGLIHTHPNNEVINSESVNKDWILNSSDNFYNYIYGGREKIAYKTFSFELNLFIISTAYLDSFNKELNFNDLNKSLQNISYGVSGYPIIFDANGVIKSYPKKELIGNNIKTIIDTQGNEIFSSVKDSTNGRLIYSYKNVNNNKSSKKILYYTFDKNSKLYICSVAYFYEYFNSVFIIIIICFISSIFIIMLMWVVTERLLLSITEPITYISNISKEIASGRLDLEINIGGIDEINGLSRSLDIMRNHMKSIIDELSRNKFELEIKVEERTKELHKVIEELKTTQDQLILTEKMSSLNGLVAGVAHEINTPIGISVTAASHLEEEMLTFNRLFKENKMTKTSFVDFLDNSVTVSRMILGSLRKASELITSFKSLAANQTYDEKGEFNLCSLVNEVILSLNHLLKPKNITINLDCLRDTYIFSYPGAISQMLLILIQNSIIHGFDNLDTGAIYIDIKREEDDIVIYYKDTGVGIKPENLNKIFEPFYTTKRNRGGTGLGLHILYNIVNTNLNGNIVCYSEVNSFTEFIIRFSVLEEL